MATSTIIDVWGAPDAEAVAQTVATALDAQAKHQGTTTRGDSWHVASPDWLVQVHAENERYPHEAPVWMSIYHSGQDIAPLYRLTDRLYTHLVENTPWGLNAVADNEAEFPDRSRPALG